MRLSSVPSQGTFFIFHFPFLGNDRFTGSYKYKAGRFCLPLFPVCPMVPSYVTAVQCGNLDMDIAALHHSLMCSDRYNLPCNQDSQPFFFLMCPF